MNYELPHFGLWFTERATGEKGVIYDRFVDRKAASKWWHSSNQAEKRLLLRITHIPEPHEMPGSAHTY